MSARKQVIFAKNYDVIANKRMKEITSKNILDIFGLFQKIK
jgi:hypothetical protein